MIKNQILISASEVIRNKYQPSVSEEEQRIYSAVNEWFESSFEYLNLCVEGMSQEAIRKAAVTIKRSGYKIIPRSLSVPDVGVYDVLCIALNMDSLLQSHFSFVVNGPNKRC